MKRFLASVTIALALSVGWMTFGHAQEPQNPFHARNHRGEIVHVLPPQAAIRQPGDKDPIDAPPSDDAAVYGASYGSGNLTDHGGAEISGAKFMAVYWNKEVADAGANLKPTIQGQIDAFVSAFSDGVNWTDRATADYAIIQQYGSHNPISNLLINAGSLVDTKLSTSTIDDIDIQNYLIAKFGSSLETSTIYGVYFPPGMTVKLGGSSSCSSFCGYHSHFTSQSKLIRYAAFPYLNCSACSLSGKSVADMLTVVTSHEIREAVTDPSDNNNYAWYDRQGYEADDKCAWHNLYPMANGGFLVQPEYSNGGTVNRSGFTATYPGPGCVVPTAVSGGGGGGNGKGHGRGGH